MSPLNDPLHEQKDESSVDDTIRVDVSLRPPFPAQFTDTIFNPPLGLLVHSWDSRFIRPIQIAH